MHQSLFIFLPKLSGYVIYEDNKQWPHFSPRKVNMWFMETTKVTWSTSLTSDIKWYQHVTCLWLITFYTCFLLEFRLFWMIVIEFDWLCFLIDVFILIDIQFLLVWWIIFYIWLIVFDDCSWLSFDCLWWLFLIEF